MVSINKSRFYFKGLYLLIMLGIVIVFSTFSSLATANQSNEPTGAKDIVTVASAMPLTGPYASDGIAMKRGLELSIAMQNKNGGLLGHKIKLVTCDIGDMAASSVQACGQRLLSDNPGAVITGYDGSVGTETFGKGKMPYLHANTYRHAVEQVIKHQKRNNNVFQYDASQTQYGVDAAKKLPKIAKDLDFNSQNKKTFAVITANYSYNKKASDTFITKMKEKGYKMVLHVVLPFGVNQWEPVLSKIARAKPAFTTFWSLNPSDAARFMNQWHLQFGVDGIRSLLYMQYTPNIPEFLTLTGKNADGLLWSSLVTPNDVIGKSSTAYTKLFSEKYNEKPHSAYAYLVADAFQIWVHAVEKVGCIKCYDKVNDAIRDIRYRGFAGVYKFTPLSEGQHALSGKKLLPIGWHQIRRGKNITVLPKSLSNAAIEMPPWVPGD